MESPQHVMTLLPLVLLVATPATAMIAASVFIAGTRIQGTLEPASQLVLKLNAVLTQVIFRPWISAS